MTPPATTKPTRHLIQEAKELARDLRAKFYEHADGPRQPIALNTEKFARCVGEEFGIEIEAQLSSELGSHLRGLLYRESGNKKAVILVAEGNNECWRRFVFIKEICHLFLDKKEIFSVAAEDLAIALLSDEDSDSPQYSSELAAAYAAIELMIPEYLKQWMRDEADVHNKTPFQIAFQLKTPKKFVEYKMREWGVTIHPESDEERR